jgi:hypothetical protein
VEVAQVAAVIGREFSYELIALVVPLSEKELQAALELLRHAGLSNMVRTLRCPDLRHELAQCPHRRDMSNPVRSSTLID